MQQAGVGHLPHQQPVLPHQQLQRGGRSPQQRHRPIVQVVRLLRAGAWGWGGVGLGQCAWVCVGGWVGACVGVGCL